MSQEDHSVLLKEHLLRSLELCSDEVPSSDMREELAKELEQFLTQVNLKEFSNETEFLTNARELFRERNDEETKGTTLDKAMSYWSDHVEKIKHAVGDRLKRKISEEIDLTNQEIKKPKADDSEYRFIVVSNDGTEENLTWLISAKNIFSLQLPKMPPEYIVRLVMDKSHHSMICIKKNEVVGSVCFRPYNQQQFAEIAFLAVSADCQVRGIGTMLMNSLKQFVKTLKLTHFLTYADNYAIGYFRKQGFTKTITMPPERWQGYIKDYDGGTLMECSISSYVDYMKIPEMVKSQKIALQKALAERIQSNMVYPGLTLFENEGRIITNVLEQVPGVREAGWGIPARSNITTIVAEPDLATENNYEDAKKEYEIYSNFQKMLKMIKGHPQAWPFKEPVPNTIVGYLDKVKNPVDLSLIKRRLDHGGYYTSPQMFYDDFTLMCENCKLFNDETTNYYAAAVQLQSFVNDTFRKSVPEANIVYSK